MSGGIAILLLLIIAAAVAIWAISSAGGIQALRHRPGGDLGATGDEAHRPTTRVAEPTDEHAVGYGVGGEHSEPQAARVPRDR